MDPEFETTVAATTSTSTSNSSGSREQEEDKSTVIRLPAIDQKAKTSATTSSYSSVKKSGGGGGRRSVQKRVVSVPIADVDGSRPKGAGEGAPPSDSWAWRKYGQKPIKGSPYPRGYYRCSSSKGCPARKQVERSRVDPTMLVVTYAADHNHPWPLPKNHHHHHHHHNHNSHNPTPAPYTTTEIAPPVSQEQEEGSPTPAATATTTNTSSSSPEETTTFSADLGEDDTPMMSMADEFCWHPYMSEASLPSVAMMLPVSYYDVNKELSSAAGSGGSGSGGGGGDEEDSLFAGLGELPECSMVFRRGFSVGAA